MNRLPAAIFFTLILTCDALPTNAAGNGAQDRETVIRVVTGAGEYGDKPVTCDQSLTSELSSIRVINNSRSLQQSKPVQRVLVRITSATPLPEVDLSDLGGIWVENLGATECVGVDVVSGEAMDFLQPGFAIGDSVFASCSIGQLCRDGALIVASVVHTDVGDIVESELSDRSYLLPCLSIKAGGQ